MKAFNIFLVILVVFHACKTRETDGDNNSKETPDPQYSSYGEAITAKNAIDLEAASELFAGLSAMDTTTTKIRASVKEVCKIKGCWITFSLPDGKEARVKFKDYGFVVPMDIEGREVVIKGKAYSDIMSVEEQRHYAIDAGEPQEKIDAITTPIWSYNMVADGILIEE